MDYDWITPRLSTGAKIGGVEDVEILVDAGVTHCIDCTWDEADQQFSGTSLFAQHPALAVLWNPTDDDGQTKGPEWFGESVDFGFMALSKPQTKLYCHCDQGRNRGPSTAFCIMLAMGWEYDDALDMIHKARPKTIGFIRYADDAANSLHEMGYL
jgi:hypothetical protein